MRRTRAILTVLAAAMALAGGCRKTQPADLVLVSPHSEDVQREFERAFNAWHQQKFGQAVKLEWRDIGGGTQITQFVKSQYERSDRSWIDIYFGGGAPDHMALAALGLLEKVELPPEILEQLPTPKQLNGIAQYDPEGYWHGACLSAFGILYNARLLREKGLPAPTAWEDLADPRMFDQTAVAGPQSGSARAAYEMILQTAPDWPSGWRRLLSFWANGSKNFTQGASDVPTTVANGQVAAGACIDYYAYMKMTQVNRTEPLLQFALPRDGMVFTPDPISVLKGAAHPEMARRFVEFVLSPQGQALWCLPAGAPDGPANAALYRQPVRRDTYQTYAGKMLPELVDVFEQRSDFVLDEKLQAARVGQILPRLMQAAATDHREKLHRAWGRIIERGRPEELMAEFTALPEDLATLEALLATAEKLAQAEKDNDQRAIYRITTAWQTFFGDKYDRILRQ